MVKYPQEDFKNILDEAERKQIKINDQIHLDKQAPQHFSDREPSTQQTDQPSQDFSESGCSSQPAREEVSNEPEVKKTKSSNKDGEKLSSLYPGIQLCGKMNDLYRCEEALEFIKNARDVFCDMNELNKKLVTPLNRIHWKMTG